MGFLVCLVVFVKMFFSLYVLRDFKSVVDNIQYRSRLPVLCFHLVTYDYKNRLICRSQGSCFSSVFGLKFLSPGL